MIERFCSCYSYVVCIEYDKKILHNINFLVNKILIPPAKLCTLLTNRAGAASLSMVLGVEEEVVDCVVRVEVAALEGDWVCCE